MNVDYDVLERIVLDSSDSKVRARTVTHLAEMYRGSDDSRITALLTKVIRNNAERQDIRLIAYFVLFEVVGRPLKDIPSLDQLRFPDDLDWAFVERYSQQSQE